MSLYDTFLNSVKDLKSKISKDPTTMDNVSGALAAEMTVTVSLLLAALLLRHISAIASVVVIIFLAILLLSNMPLAPKLKREGGDSLEKMTFYIVITLGVLISLIYWGLKYV